MFRVKTFSMPQFKLLLTLFVVLVIHSNVASGSAQERKLLNDLLANYNVLERPVEKPENAVPVYLSVTLMQIVRLDAKTGVLQTNLWLTTQWNDFNLKWNPQTYGNISGLRIAPNRVWRPDILIYNSVDPKFDPAFNPNIAVKHDGNMTLISPGIFSTSCKFDSTWFPFDEQRCAIKFGSWSLDGLELDLKLQEGSETGADISSFTQDSEWELVEMPVRRNEIYYACCPEPYVDITFMLRVRRRSELHLSQAQLFNALIGITLMLSFLTPLKSAHKVTLVIISLLMNSWILSAIQAVIPPHNSVLVFYFSCLFLINFVGLVMNVITLYLFHTTTSMPNWGRSSFLDSIPLLQFICPLKKESKPAGGKALVESGTGDNDNAVEDRTELEYQRADASPWRRLACILDRCFFVLFTLILLIFHGVYFPAKQ